MGTYWGSAHGRNRRFSPLGTGEGQECMSSTTLFAGNTVYVYAVELRVWAPNITLKDSRVRQNYMSFMAP